MRSLHDAFGDLRFDVHGEIAEGDKVVQRVMMKGRHTGALIGREPTGREFAVRHTYIWRLAGDTATDFNHYSKRAILIGVYGSTSLVFLDDESEDLDETRAFLDRRIEGVMRFEKAKARWRGTGDKLPSLSRFLGRLRYPAI